MSEGKIVETNTPRQLKLKYGKRTIKIEYRQEDGLQEKVFELDNLGKNSEFIQLITEQPIETAHTGETSLEDIFIKLIGDKL